VGSGLDEGFVMVWVVVVVGFVGGGGGGLVCVWLGGSGLCLAWWNNGSGLCLVAGYIILMNGIIK